MVSNTKILSSSNIYKSPWLTLREDKLCEHNGNTTSHLVLEMKPGVMILPITHSGNIMLVKQYRYAIAKETWEVIGGGIDQDELPIDAAKRELLEETGFTSTSWISIGSADWGTDTLLSKIWFYVVKDFSIGNPKPDPTEKIQIGKFNIATAFDMIEKGEISHLPSITLLLWVRQLGLFN